MKVGRFCCQCIRILLLLVVMSSTVALVGCAQQKVWTKKGLNQDDFDRDVARCEQEAAKATQIVNYAYETGPELGLDRSVTRDNLIRKCMYTKGYKREDK